MLTIFVRVTPTGNGKERPPWFSKATCIRSVIDAAANARMIGHDVRIVLVQDVSSGLPLAPEVTSLMNRFDAVIEIRGGSAMKSWRALLPHVMRAARAGVDDVIYIVEDDHLHRPDALTALMSTNAQYRFLYSTPVDRGANTSTSGATESTRQWVPIESGVSSFGVTTGAMRRDRWIHRLMSYGGGSWDELTCRALGSGARTVYGGGLYYVLWPLTRHSPWVGKSKARAAWHSGFRALALLIAVTRRNVSMLGLVPPAVTHAEPGLIAEGTDWQQVADAVGTA